MRTKPLSLSTAILAGVIFVLAGCGNKGSLTLPPRPAAVQPKPVPATSPEEKPAKAADHSSATAPATAQ